MLAASSIPARIGKSQIFFEGGKSINQHPDITPSLKNARPSYCPYEVLRESRTEDITQCGVFLLTRKAEPLIPHLWYRLFFLRLLGRTTV